MIRITRPAKGPDWLDSETVKEAEKAIKELVELNGKAMSTEFTSHWRKDEVRLALWSMQHGKCCYCERHRDPKREPDIEHFRPKAAVEEDKTHPGYWWLAYNWENLFFCCKTCNEDYKKNHFPIRDGTKRSSGPHESRQQESRLLLDPCDDDPEDELAWYLEPVAAERPTGRSGGAAPAALFVFVRGETDRGETTARTLGLNRTELLSERAMHVFTMHLLIKKAEQARRNGWNHKLAEAITQIQDQTCPKKTFSGLRRFLVRQAGLGEYLLPLAAAERSQVMNLHSPASSRREEGHDGPEQSH